MTETPPSQEGSEQAGAEGPALESDENGQDDLKAKFREALARKHGTQAETATQAANSDGSKVRGGRGPVASQRSFRRKSGG